MNGGTTHHTMGAVYQTTAPQWSPPMNGGTTPLPSIEYLRQEYGPQWSPPMNGGTTILRPARRRMFHVPQWSPPMNGGTTPQQILEHAHARTPPQWSPPMNGGTTRMVQFESRLLAMAAMEPADERRDDTNGRGCPPTRDARRNGARR